MTRPVSLLELRTRSLAAADMRTLGANQYIQPDEHNFVVNESYSELYDLLMLAFDDYFVTSVPITLVAGQASYPLPADFYKPRGLYYNASAQDVTELTPFQENERAGLLSQISAGRPTRYRIEDGGVTVLSAGSTGNTVTFRYVPQCPWLKLDTDTVHPNVAAGWDAYIVYDVAAVLRGKANKDSSSVERKRDRLGARITAARGQRTTTGAKRVSDVYGWCRLNRGG